MTKTQSIKVSQTSKNSSKSSETSIPTMEEQIEVASSIALTFSKSNGIEFSDLFSEAQEKLININKNYIPELGGKFLPYLKSSLRGYLKNYIRDHSFKVKIPRRITDTYMKTRKYSSFLIASLHTKWSEEEIRYAHNKMKKFREYNVAELQHWNTELDTLTCEKPLTESQQIIEEAGVNKYLLFDVYINDVPEHVLKRKYGKTWKKKVQKDIEKLRKTCKFQDLLDEELA